MSHEQFWESTYEEISDILKSFNRKLEFKRKEKASFDYILADLIGLSAGRLMSEGNKYPTINQSYPSLFPLSEETEDTSWLSQKMSMMKFAASHNKWFESQEVNQ
jgi:hypothetical protein